MRAIADGTSTIEVDADITGAVTEAGYLHVPGSAFRLSADLADALDRFAADYDDLPLDPYLPDGGAYRRRRHVRYHFDGTTGSLVAQPPGAYHQSAEVNPWIGGEQRWFAPATDEIRDNPFLTGLLTHNIRQFPTDLAGTWVIDVHLVRVLATPAEEGKPSPEGIHRDGFDFIALHLIGRHNVTGGRSMITDADGDGMTTLTLGSRLDSIYAEDARIRHGAEPVALDVPESGAGHRDMLLTSYQRV